ncbi:MAG: hypothetical protein ACRDD1_07005, partial [Planctomycetia bacterium]
MGLAAWSGSADAEPPAPPDARARLEAEVFVDPATQATVFALSLQDAPAPRGAVDAAVLVDLSADSAGPWFAATHTLTSGLVNGLVGGSRVQLWTTTRPEEPLLDRPAAVGSSAVAAALAELSQRTPLGAADLSTLFPAVVEWLNDREENLPKVVVLIGDGGSARRPLTLPVLQNTAARLRQAETPFYWTVVGRRSADDSPLASLAARTGGLVGQTRFTLRPSTTPPFSEVPRPTLEDPAGEIDRLLAAVATPVFFPNAFRVSPPPDILLPTSETPPLRSDRPTLFAGRWKNSPKAVSIEFDGRKAGRPASHRLDATPSASDESKRYLQDVVKRWEAEPGRPAVRSAEATLTLSRADFSAGVALLADQARAALAGGRRDQAKELFQLAAARNPADPIVAAGLEEASRPPANDPAAVLKTADRDELAEAKARDRVEAQRVAAEVRAALADAQKLAKTDVDAAIQLLKRTL